MTLVLNHIKHKDLDFAKWDQTIIASELPTVFAYSYFLNATSPGWDALVINDYETVFPLTWKRKFGFLYLPQPFFTGQLGAFGTLNLARESLFYNYILKNYKLVEIELNASNQLESKYNTPKNTFVIEYNKGYAFNQNTRRNIAKAQATGFKVEEVSANEIISLSEKVVDPFLLTELKLPAKEVLHFRDLLANCIENASIHTFKACDSENCVKAIGHFVFNSKYVVFLKGTNIDKSDNSGSMHLLICHAIRFFEKKCDCFDFGGGSLHEGLAGFYKGLGGVQRDYHLLRVNNLPRLLKFFKK